jgi:hypothetical protein
MGERPTKPKSQGLERHRTQDRPSPSTRGQVDCRIFLEDAGHMDRDAQAISYDRMIQYLSFTEDRLDCSTGSRFIGATQPYCLTPILLMNIYPLCTLVQPRWPDNFW